MHDDHDHTDHNIDDPFDHPREPMSMDYEDDYDLSEKKGFFSALLDDSPRRRLVYGAFFLGSLLVLGVGGWVLLGHHQKEIPVMGPPQVPVRTKPANPGGMQLDVPNLAEGGAKQKVELAQLPEKPDLAAVKAQYGTVSSNQPTTSRTPVVGNALESQKVENTTENKAENTVKPVQTALPSVAQRTSQSKLKNTSEQHHILVRDESQHKRGLHHVSARHATTHSSTVSASKGIGHYTVQLAALQSLQDADREWSHLQKHYASLFAGKRYKVVKVELTKATFYRLQVPGFASLAKADAFCHQVRNRGLACIIAR